MINSITLKYLRNAEFIQFSKDVLTIVQGNDPAALLATDAYNDFSAITVAIDRLFKTDQGSDITAAIETLDLRRDRAINGISLSVQANTYHFTASIATAATTLANHLQLFGAGVAKENYQSETAIISSMVADWAGKPELVAAIAVLGLGSWIMELDTANRAFNDTYLARTREMATATPDTIKAKRLEAAGKWYTLRDTIDAYFLLKKGTEPWAKTTKELDTLVDQYNALIASRQGKNPDIDTDEDANADTRTATPKQ